MSVEQVRVLDSGKVGVEHFEFNRGVLEALRGVGVDVTFHAFGSMTAEHAAVTSRENGGQVTARPYSLFGIEDKPTRLARALAKIGGLWPTMRALQGRERLVVVYAAPISHVLLAVASRWRKAPMVVFLHAEVEFLSSDQGPRLIGEKLMTLALRLAAPRLRYLMLTDEGVRVMRERGSTRAEIGFCPHPMSDRVFAAAPANAGTLPRTGAFTMIKKAADVVAVRALLRTLPPKVEMEGGCADACTGAIGCHFNGEGLIETEGDDPGAVIARKRFLSREALEAALHTVRWFLFPPGTSEYALTASGLACSAAAAGARVIGQGNAFMRCYAARYPQAFSIAGHSETASPGSPVDNLSEVASNLLASRPS